MAELIGTTLEGWCCVMVGVIVVVGAGTMQEGDTGAVCNK